MLKQNRKAPKDIYASDDSSIPKHKPVVIAVSGKALAGKDTVMNMLQKQLESQGHSVKLFSHAYPIKKMMTDILEFTKSQVYDQDHKNDIHELWGMSGREAMLKIGTDMFRNIFHPNAWVILLNVSISRCKADYILMQDVRFVNEALNINNNGGYLINIVRDKYYLTKRYKFWAKFFYYNQWLFHIFYKLKLVSFRWHMSEICDLSEFVDHQIENYGTLEDLNKSACKILEDIQTSEKMVEEVTEL